MSDHVAPHDQQGHDYNIEIQHTETNCALRVVCKLAGLFLTSSQPVHVYAL